MITFLIYPIYFLPLETPAFLVKAQALSGHLCDVSLHPDASVGTMHMAIFLNTNSRVDEQRLFVRTREMTSGSTHPIHYLPPGEHTASRELLVTLVRCQPLHYVLWVWKSVG